MERLQLLQEGREGSRLPSIGQPYRLSFISEAEAEIGESAYEIGEKEKSPSSAFNALSLPYVLYDHTYTMSVHRLQSVIEPQPQPSKTCFKAAQGCFLPVPSTSPNAISFTSRCSTFARNTMKEAAVSSKEKACQPASRSTPLGKLFHVMAHGHFMLRYPLLFSRHPRHGLSANSPETTTFTSEALSSTTRPVTNEVVFVILSPETREALPSNNEIRERSKAFGNEKFV